MSDPMTNTDVEDVLASIRRLVSDTGRPASAAVQTPPSDRLVLTPSLRVPEDTAEEALDEDADEAVEEDAIDSTTEDQNADEDDLSTFARTAFGHDAPVSNDLDVVDDSFDFEDESGVEAERSDDMPSEDEFAATAVPDEGLEEPEEVDVLDAALDEDDAETHLIADVTGLIEDADEPEVDAADTEVPIVPEDWAAEPSAAASSSSSASEPQTLSEKIAALETLVAERRDQFEPDDTGADAYAGTEPPAMEWEDVEPEAPFEAVEAEDIVEEAPLEPETAQAFEAGEVEDNTSDPEPAEIAEDPAVDDVAAASAGLFAPDDDVLDEDALRELISDIVREELQGALGERITRNVRKLVRREIHRALAAQDLE